MVGTNVANHRRDAQDVVEAPARLGLVDGAGSRVLGDMQVRVAPRITFALIQVNGNGVIGQVGIVHAIAGDALTRCPLTPLLQHFAQTRSELLGIAVKHLDTMRRPAVRIGNFNSQRRLGLLVENRDLHLDALVSERASRCRLDAETRHDIGSACHDEARALGRLSCGGHEGGLGSALVGCATCACIKVAGNQAHGSGCSGLGSLLDVLVGSIVGGVFAGLGFAFPILFNGLVGDIRVGKRFRRCRKRTRSKLGSRFGIAQLDAGNLTQTGVADMVAGTGDHGRRSRSAHEAHAREIGTGIGRKRGRINAQNTCDAGLETIVGLGDQVGPCIRIE